MEDDYKITLKGKINILYQLGKLQDVIKLSKQYNEKYGKDVDVDMMCFKSERRLSKSAPPEEIKAPNTTQESQAQKSSELLDNSEIVDDKEPPLLLTADHEVVKNQAMLVTNESPVADQPRLVEDNLDNEPFTEANVLIITDPFAEDKPEITQATHKQSPEANELIIIGSYDQDKPEFNKVPQEPSPPEASELIITDPYAKDKPEFSEAPQEKFSPEAKKLTITDPFSENEPVFNLARNEPPVILVDSGKAENAQIRVEPRDEEMAIIEESPSEFVNTKIAFDFKGNSAMAIDVEPTLTPAPKAESIANQSNDAGKKLPAESLAPDPTVADKLAETWDETSVSKAKEIPLEPEVESAAFHINELEKKLAPESFMEMALEKPQPLSEPFNNPLKKTPSPKKIAFNFKYFLVLILPLAAAVILWLLLSGKLNLAGGAAEKISPVSVVEPPAAVAQMPARKVTPAVQIPRIDEKEKLINEKISQANDFIKNKDFLKALAVVLEAKKIKMTEPLRLLEELITKKIREDESRAEEQKQTVQSVEQPEDQAYAKAETENTLESWQNFILQYPQGEFIALARNKIVVLQKKATQKAEQELQLKIKQAQKLKLRSDYMDLSQAELNTASQQLGKPTAQFEHFEHEGENLIIDFSSGLMWTLWNKPMGFDKAKWWANRIYARYSGWRLPTVEESFSLLQMDPSLYAGLADFSVWTGDGISDQSRSIWVLKLPQGKFIPEDYSQVHYVWAVRKAGK